MSVSLRGIYRSGRVNRTRRGPASLAALFVATGSLIVSCKPASPQRSKLWSVKTAEAFARLVKEGRSVATIPGDGESDHAKLALNGGINIGGVEPLWLEMDPSGQVLVSARFDAKKSPPVSENEVITYTKDLVARSAGVLRVDVSELVALPVTPAHSRLRTVAFRRAVSGTIVRDSRLMFTFARAGGALRLIEIQNRTWGHLKPEALPASSRLTAAQLAQVTKTSGLKIIADGSGYLVDDHGPAPTLRATTWYQVEADDGQKFTLTFSGGQEPTLLEAFSHKFDGTLHANTYQRVWGGAKALFPVPDAAFDSGSGAQALDGEGGIPGGATSGKISLRAKWIRVGRSGGGAASYEVGPEGNNILVKSEEGSAESGINVYVALSRLRKYVMRFYAGANVTYFGRQIAVTTDMPQTCNAYYTGLTLNFFSKGGGCANMALVNDVIYHEWGHGLDEYTGPGSDSGDGLTDGAFSEGIGDIVAMFMNHDSDMGAGFFTSDPSRPLRKLENKKVYIKGQSSEIHAQGTIIGGAFWELRKRMVNKYGEAGHDKAAQLFFTHLLEAESYLDSYDIVQKLADDDQNPATRHSDWCLVNHAFSVKGLTKEDPCQDDYATSSQGQNSQVSFALGDAGSSGATPVWVAAATGGAKSVRLCPGRESCQQPVVLQLARTSGAISFFGPANWTVKDGDVVNAQVVSDSGAELARGIARFTKK